MPYRLMLLAVAALAGGCLQAGPVACVPGGTLASYEALGATGCNVGPLLVNNFAFSVLSGSGSVTDSTIFVTPTHPSSRVYGLNFASTGFTVTGSGSVMYLVGYTWDPTDDIQSLDDVMDPPIATPPGFSKVTTTGCLQAAFTGAVCSTSTTTVTVSQDGITPHLTDSASFAAVAVLGIRNVIDLEGGGTGSASFDSFSNEVTIPEPATGLTAVGCLALLALGCRRRG
jgi:hypothetical protein